MRRECDKTWRAPWLVKARRESCHMLILLRCNEGALQEQIQTKPSHQRSASKKLLLRLHHERHRCSNRKICSHHAREEHRLRRCGSVVELGPIIFIVYSFLHRCGRFLVVMRGQRSLYIRASYNFGTIYMLWRSSALDFCFLLSIASTYEAMTVQLSLNLTPISCHGQNVTAPDVCLRHTDQPSR